MFEALHSYDTLLKHVITHIVNKLHIVMVNYIL